jgi:hypothetical protein
MSVMSCRNCQGKTPATSIVCVHCGALAPTCWKCGGTGKCPKCKGTYPETAGCNRCQHSGKCPECNGRRRAWAGTGANTSGT